MHRFEDSVGVNGTVTPQGGTGGGIHARQNIRNRYLTAEGIAELADLSD